MDIVTITRADGTVIAYKADDIYLSGGGVIRGENGGNIVWIYVPFQGDFITFTKEKS